MLFRRDINALRAIAVIAVMLFHFLPDFLTGGFIGVDVFFVISGFLMTKIILEGIKSNNFSIIEFYFKRGLRIIPALTVLCLVLLALGWFWLTPLDYRQLAKHVACSLGFISNFAYAFESGYFATAASEKFLLHTWSLAVEMQFYIIYPLFLVFLAKKFTLKKLRWTLVFALILGFIFSQFACKFWATGAYYLLPSRCWQLLAGGVVYLFPLTKNTNPIIKKSLFYSGLLAILVASIFISKYYIWPGYLAIIPVLVACLVLQAEDDNSFITANPVLAKVGLWSYSIYLWHWPLVVIKQLFALSITWVYLAIPLAVFLGFLSYQLVETRFKYKPQNITQLLNSIPVYSCVLAGLFGCYIYFTNGKNANEFLMSNSHILIYPQHCTKECLNKTKLNCFLGSPEKKTIGLLWGDSYAGNLEGFIMKIFKGKNSIISRAIHAFPIGLNSNINNLFLHVPKLARNIRIENCKLKREITIKEIYNQYYDIIFLASLGGIESNIIETIDFCAKHAKLVYFFSAPINYSTHVTNTFTRSQVSKFYPQDLIRNDESSQAINKKFKQAIAAKNYTNVFFVDRETLYGSENPQDLTPEGLPYTFDTGHLTEIGSINFAKNFMKSKLYIPLKKLLESQL